MVLRFVLQFDRINLPEDSPALRAEVREFLAAEAEHLARPNSDFGTGHDAEFSRKLGARGWIGMTWPKKYGGHERSYLDRYVVTEEFRAVTAPTWGHFVADRQSGPVILKYGSEKVKEEILPRLGAPKIGR